MKKTCSKFYRGLFLVAICFFCAGNASATQWDVGSGQIYTSIQAAIDNSSTLDGDVINVHGGTYHEDVTVNKKLIIQANNGDDVEINPANTAFTLVNDGTGDGSGSTIRGFIINSPPHGVGVNISADNCKIENNRINGGKTGIAVSGCNSTILNNVISGPHENGIFANISQGFFTVSGNRILNMNGDGIICGVTVSTNGTLDSFNLSGNTLSNISTSNGAVFGFQLGKSKGAGGNPELASVASLVVAGNIIDGVTAFSAIMGMEIVSDSVNAIISGNRILNLQGSANSSVYALEAAIVGNGTVEISKNIISSIVAGQQAVGMVIVAIGDLKMEGNLVSGISKASASVAMLGLGLLNNATLKNNIASDITSPGVAAGIVGVALAHLEMIHNMVNGVNGTRDVSMVAAGFNTTRVTGNNIEGDGAGIGIVICSPDGTINYNRIASYEYYIQNFLFSNFGPSIDEMLKPLDDAIKEHPELEPILKPIRDDMDRLFHQLENSNTNASYNWYGTNSPDNAKFFPGNGTLNYYPWLVLKIDASPSTINPSETSTITASVYHDVAGGDHSADAALFFSGPRVTFTTSLGNLGSKSITVPWTNGMAITVLRADEGPGTATVTARDYQLVQTTVNIRGSPGPGNRTNTTTVVGMETTGSPVAGIIVSMLLVLGGLTSARRL